MGMNRLQMIYKTNSRLMLTKVLPTTAPTQKAGIRLIMDIEK